MFYRQKYTTYKMYVINEQGEQVDIQKGGKVVSKSFHYSKEILRV